MLFRSPARKRQSLIKSAMALADTTKTLTDIQLKLAWSKLQVRIASAGRLSRQRDQLKKELPEALALVRDAGRRALGLEAFPVQMEGALVLMDGQIAEMRTGEGKTLVAAMGAALSTLIFKHVHLVTVNEYLAQRDCALMTPLFAALGLDCRVVLSTQQLDEKRVAYDAHVTYGVNSEFGFDFLRNHMVANEEDKTQPALHESLAIVDEADAILIDDARTPLIITQTAPVPVDHLPKITRLANALVVGEDFVVDEKEFRATLTEQGYAKAEHWMHEQGWLAEHAHLYDGQGVEYLYRLDAALKARTLYTRNVQYMVDDQGTVSIIDESTGRILLGRRWSEGLHQAIEAKEGVAIQPETEVQATITYQHFFRLYGGLAGLTGTAATEKEELEEMYGLLVSVINTHRPVARQDYPDRVYKTKREKFAAILAEIRDRHAKGQPVLLGTPSVAVSDELSELLARAGLKHALLNARQNQAEAEVVAQAGLPGAITVATNMAGRGTDIILGGNFEKEIKALKADGRDAEAAELHARWKANREQVLAAGGLFVIGAERHESRRIDNQLRGRAGRQGDPGESRFFLSLEDDLLRVFGKGLGRFAMNQLEEGEALEAGMLTRAIARAQQARENMGFEQRKQLAKFDGVLADQRAAVYKLRNQMLTEDTRELLATWGESQFQVAAHHALPKDQMLEEIAVEDVYTAFRTELSWTPDIHQIAHLLEHSEDTAAVARELHAAWAPHFESQLDVAEAMTGGKLHLVGLTALDKLWRAQLTQLDQLREGIHLRSYAQKDPQREYYEEAGRLFESMALALHREAMELLAGALVAQQEQVAPQPLPVAAPRQEAGPSYRRNRACECGSGQRFKNCCGNLRVTPELEVLPGMVMGMNMTFRPRG